MPEYRITVDDKSYSVNIGRIEDDKVEVTLGGRTFSVGIEYPGNKSQKTPILSRGCAVPDASSAPDKTSAPGQTSGMGKILAPLPGTVLKILVAMGDQVTKGQTVAVMEAMKMENEIEAPVSGKISQIAVKEGDTILENALIMSIG
ncbi:MAG: acetyl-CoA carboxylase biotin carboxyl carrier protein subunit [Candidatus Sabulitectum sp.]|nr:acetyl-CoA carboxylase biotin carboxyl carrier protein subunit [Candidatus Sabulitectum sp.]